MKNNFDGLRLVAALMVLVIHQLGQQGIGDPVLLMMIGRHAVSIFFGISGYLIVSSWMHDADVARFAARRLLRIWPALAVVVCVLSAFFWSNPQTPDFLRFIAFYGFDGTFFSNKVNPALDASLWTIQMEMLCYLLVIVVGKGRWLGLAVAIAFVLWYGKPLLLLALVFAAGAAVRLLPRHAVVIALAGSLYSPEIAIGALAVLIGQRSWPVLRSAAREGDLSYGTYLWGWPITQAGLMLFGNQTWLLGLTLVVTVSIAWLSWHLVEAPALRLKPFRPTTRAVASEGFRLAPSSR